MSTMKWATGRLCTKCGKLLSEQNPFDTCYNCRAETHAFNKGYTCSEYGTNDRTMVFSLKYHDHPEVAEVLGEIMADRMLNEFSVDELRSEYDLLVPVPISEKRAVTRGYNQAVLMAESFAKRTGLPYSGEILWRTRETSVMRGLNPAERKNNIRGSFGIRPEVKGSVIGASCLIIDDIYTTGATVDEIAMTLLEGGAEKVDYLSFASGADVIKS